MEQIKKPNKLEALLKMAGAESIDFETQCLDVQMHIVQGLQRYDYRRLAFDISGVQGIFNDIESGSEIDSVVVKSHADVEG